MSRVFITGGSGFIGGEIVAQVLDAGFRARLSIRRAAQEADLRARYASHADKLEFVVIPDLGNRAAVRAALAEDVDHVVHVASPIPGKADGDDLQTAYIDPAVNSLTTVLEAVATAPHVRRLVVTSSILSLVPQQFDAPVIREGANAGLVFDRTLARDPVSKYHASKLLAHRAALDWVAAHPGLHFDVATVHPTYVLGHDRTRTSATPQGSTGLFWGALFKPAAAMNAWFVDVRDVAAIHVRALTTTTALRPRGQITEFIANTKPQATWEGVLALLQRKYPTLPVQIAAPFPPVPQSDTTRTEQALGVAWHNIDEAIEAVVDQQLALEKGQK